MGIVPVKLLLTWVQYQWMYWSSMLISGACRTNLTCIVYLCVFSAPEVLTVYPYDHAADWWSVGILMYTMLLGKVERLLLGPRLLDRLVGWLVFS